MTNIVGSTQSSEVPPDTLGQPGTVLQRLSHQFAIAVHAADAVMTVLAGLSGAPALASAPQTNHNRPEIVQEAANSNGVSPVFATPSNISSAEHKVLPVQAAFSKIEPGTFSTVTVTNNQDEGEPALGHAV